MRYVAPNADNIIRRCDEVTHLVALVKACAKTKDLCTGIQLHDEILNHGLLNKCSEALVTMYAKCGALLQARELFDMHKTRDVFTWNALIAGYANNGQAQHALECFEGMKREGLPPDAVTFVCILKACGVVGMADVGEQVHEEILRQGLLRDNIVLGTALLDMYVKCGALNKAHKVLQEFAVRDVVSWNALIAGHAQQGQGEQALGCFEQMQSEGISPDRVTFLGILKACGSIGAGAKGEHFHDEIVRQGLLGSDIVLGTALVDMYAKCGAFAKAQQVLQELPARNVVSWNALIAGYVQRNNGKQALKCYEKMQCEGLSPDVVTFIGILKACGSTGAEDKGQQIHDEIARQGLLENNTMLGNALVDMYVKCGALEKAQEVLQELPTRDVVSWSALITGYAQLDQGEQALDCFERMKSEGLSPNAITFSCILKACGSIGAVDRGENIHDEIARQGLLGNDIVLGTALVDMYAKCGTLEKAQRVLENLPTRNAVSWNALIAGYAQQAQGEQARNCYARMQSEGIFPDAATFSSLLSACSLSGLLDDAQMVFLMMSTDYGLKPDFEHYACLVDLLARAGHLEKAAGVVRKMPSSTNVVWSSFLGACQKSVDVNVGRWAFERALQVDKSDGAAYALMASVYRAAGMHGDAETLRLRG